MLNRSTRNRRRFFQFSLRSLMMLVTLAVGLLVAWRVYVEPYHQQRETMKLIEEVGGTYKTESAEKWLRWLYGDDFQNVVLVDLADCDNPDAYLDRVAALPRLETLVVGGQSFGDEHLGRLKGLDTLRGLVLDSTSVTNQAIKSLQLELQHLAVFRSQRRAIAAIWRFPKNPLVPNWALVEPITIELSRTCPQPCRIVGKEYLQEATRVELRGFRRVRDADLIYVKALITLRSLCLIRIPITDAGLQHLRGLISLRELLLDSKQVTDAGVAHLKGLTNLESLGLGSGITDAGLVHLNGLTKLQRLSLEGQVTDTGLVHLLRFNNLRSLGLSNTKVTDSGLVRIGRLAKLRVLRLDGTRVSSVGLAHLKGFSELQMLVLNGTQVRDAGLVHLKGFTNMRVLCLGSTPVSDAGLVHIKRMTDLVLLDLDRTRVTTAGLKDLRQALPNCDIPYSGRPFEANKQPHR